VHGANRLGGNALAETQVFGKRAGEFAGKAKKRVRKIDASQVHETRNLLDQYITGNDNPAHVRKALQLAMWQGVNIFRKDAELRHACTTIDQLSLAPLRAETPQNLTDCCIVRNMCQTASLITRSALLRPESRGAHMRVDVQQKWDAEHSPFSHTYISRNLEGIETAGGIT